MFRLPLLATLTLLVGAPSLPQPAPRPAVATVAHSYRPIEAIRWTYDDESFRGDSSWQLRFRHDRSSSSIGPSPSSSPASQPLASPPPPSEAAPGSEAPSVPLAETLRHSLPPSARSLSLLGLLLIAIGVVLYLARVVFIPLTFALMLSFLLSPLVSWLERWRLPRPVGAALIVMSLLGGVGVTALTQRHVTLEDVFVSLVGKGLD